MKHVELSVYAADSNYNLNIDGVYRAENKLIVLGNLKCEGGCALATCTWYSVGVDIDVAEDLPIECYITGDDSFQKIKNTPAYITAEQAEKLVHGLTSEKFTQTKLDAHNTEFVKNYENEREKIDRIHRGITGWLLKKVELRKDEFKKQGKETEYVDPWAIEFKHLSPAVYKRVNELAEQGQLDNEGQLQKLIDECTLKINELIKPKLSFLERMEKSTGLSRQRLFTAASAGVAALAVGVEFIRRSRP